MVSDFGPDSPDPAFMKTALIRYEPWIVIVPQQYIAGRSGKRQVDHAIEMVLGIVVGVTEVTPGDFN